jgi:hypothetical protein
MRAKQNRLGSQFPGGSCGGDEGELNSKERLFEQF